MLIVAALVAMLFLAERLAPVRILRFPVFGRLLVNAVISALAFAIAEMLVRPAAMATLERVSSERAGLLALGPSSPVFQFVLALLAMDLTFYWWHVANHRIPFLWRFHNVHHIDPDLDVTTAFRFHPGEMALSAAFRIVQVSVIGLPAPMFAAYELAFQANTAFHHSNVRLPIRLERLLNLVLVTPRMHGIHHSQVRDETNSNYSVVFSWWDRLHRTIGLNIPQSAITIGVPAYGPADNRLASALLIPFRRQRDYWRRPDGSMPERLKAENCGYLAE
jgi:sterol desaturase/sphingolipid hydroxylase (fatty acid hydroxylase superfamily)